MNIKVTTYYAPDDPDFTGDDWGGVVEINGVEELTFEGSEDGREHSAFVEGYTAALQRHANASVEYVDLPHPDYQ